MGDPQLRDIYRLDARFRCPDELSGGQQQRVAIARALALRRDILLLDEVTSALDPELVTEVLDTIRNEGMTMLIVSHEMAFIREVASLVAFMDQGRIVEAGPPARPHLRHARDAAPARLHRQDPAALMGWNPPGMELLRGAIDGHVHAAPHLNTRLEHVFEATRQPAAAGMRAIGLMCHFQNISGYAALGTAELGLLGCEAFGGLIMQPVAGGVSLEAARTALGYG